VIVRESSGLSPMAKLLGIAKTLRLYELITGRKRILHNPSTTLIKKIIKEQKECPHIFARKSDN